MPLPQNFRALINPEPVPPPLDEHPAAMNWEIPLAYEARFYVMRYRATALALCRHLGQPMPTNGKNFFRLLGPENNDQVQRAIRAVVPPNWIAAIPDILRSGSLKRLEFPNTHWGCIAANQIENAWTVSPQTLPKALLAIAVLYLIAQNNGVDWNLIQGVQGGQPALGGPVEIRPSIFWVQRYDEQVYRGAIAGARDRAYAECGISGERIDTLKEAANGFCLTWPTATNLVKYLGTVGPVDLAEPALRRRPPAKERPIA